MAFRFPGCGTAGADLVPAKPEGRMTIGRGLDSHSWLHKARFKALPFGDSAKNQPATENAHFRSQICTGLAELTRMAPSVLSGATPPSLTYYERPGRAVPPMIPSALISPWLRWPVSGRRRSNVQRLGGCAGQSVLRLIGTTSSKPTGLYGRSEPT
jgi:hypothetical protein